MRGKGGAQELQELQVWGLLAVAVPGKRGARLKYDGGGPGVKKANSYLFGGLGARGGAGITVRPGLCPAWPGAQRVQRN